MLIMLNDEQVADIWSQIVKTFPMVFPPHLDYELLAEELFKLILIGDYQLWLSLDAEKKPRAYVITTTDTSFIIDKYLLIYAVAKLQDSLTLQDLKEDFEVLKKYAKDQGYKQIKAFTNMMEILSLADALQAKVEGVYIKWEV